MTTQEPTRRKKIEVMVPSDLHRRIAAAARQERRTVSAFAWLTLEKALRGVEEQQQGQAVEA